MIARCILLLALVASTFATVTITNIYRPPAHDLQSNRSVPALPYQSWGSWTVYTKTGINPAGNTSELFSVGMHVNVDSAQQVVCQYNMQELFPATNYWSNTMVINYTAGTNKTVQQNDSGKNSNCTDQTISGKMQPGGMYYLAPSPIMMRKMKFLQYAETNGYNCTVWQYQDVQTQSLLQWYVSVNANVPQVLINETLDTKTGNRTIHTTAFNGYQPLEGQLNDACLSDLTCGARTCVANPSASASSVQGALTWVCGQDNGALCNNITIGGYNYYPNSPVAHATWAFNAYYVQNEAAGAGSCNFNGAAELVACSTTCTTCNVSKTATTEEMDAALAWVCGPDGIQMGGCAAIRSGGSAFFPNNTKSHLDYAFNLYYQAYRCIPGYQACNFNGTASIVPCNK